MSQRILERTLLFNIIYIMRTFREYRALDRQATISLASHVVPQKDQDI